MDDRSPVAGHRCRRFRNSGDGASGVAGRRRVRRVVLVGFVALATAGGVAWALWSLTDPNQDEDGPKIYKGTGIVEGVLLAPSAFDRKLDGLLIRHEAIKDLMDEAMTHPFVVKSRRLLRGLRPGDRIRFTLKDRPGALLVIYVKKIEVQ